MPQIPIYLGSGPNSKNGLDLRAAVAAIVDMFTELYTGFSVFNVLQTQFGAVGDGSTDDFNEINAAIDAVPAAGGVVYLPKPPVAYYVNGIIDLTLSPGTTLRGDGFQSKIVLGPNGTIILGDECTVEGLRIVSTEAAPTTTGAIFASGRSRPRVRNCWFEGGGNQIALAGCTNFAIDQTEHTPPTKPADNCIWIWECIVGELSGASCAPGVFPATSSASRVFQALRSSGIQFLGGAIRGVDMTTVFSGGGWNFSGCTDSSMVGCVADGLRGADGFQTEINTGIHCERITISACVALNCGSAAGAGAHNETGDGFDIFYTDDSIVSGCIAYNCGTYGAIHPGYEIYNSQRVTVANCKAIACGDRGILLASAPNAIVSGCESRLNDGSGLQMLVGTEGETINVVIEGGQYVDNGRANSGVASEMEGIYMGAASSAIITGVRAYDTDPVAGTKIQTYGIRLENTARASIRNCNLAGNKVTAIADTAGLSDVQLDSGACYVSADRGTGAAVTLQVGVDSPIQRFESTLTQNIVITLSNTDAYNGAWFEIQRTGGGSFTIDVGGLMTLVSGLSGNARVVWRAGNWKKAWHGTM